MIFDLKRHPHRRFNPLTREWVLVSPHRDQRPWKGKVEEPSKETRPAYDEGCYLCPGNRRANGEINPKYESVYVFDNDFSALLPDTPEGSSDGDSLFRAESERGLCRVICFSPFHNLSMSLMNAVQIRSVIEAWTAQYEEIGALDFVRHVQIFENRGEIMGCSNPHPHGQIWSNESIPMIVAKEWEAQKDYLQLRRSCLLCDYLSGELERRERTVVETAHWLAVVPFWAVWPYETLVLPKSHHGALPELDSTEQGDLAVCLKELTTRYDNRFETAFPYSMGIHQSPTDGLERPEMHLHLHFYPPLLRSASVKKFMVGYEMLGEPQRDITPEKAADQLREQPNVHYTEKIQS